MKNFSNLMGYTHKHITPLWPRANGTVERFNRAMKEAIQKGNIEKIPMREAVLQFLQSYRATPHRATGVSPYAAIYGGRQMRTQLPNIPHKDMVVQEETSK